MGSGTVEGGCFCGEVRFALELPTTFCVHCHCSMCRRAHGAGYVTWVGARVERFRILKGETLLRRFDSSEHGTRSFCSRCGSTLLCESTRHPEIVDVVLANVEGEVGRIPEAHVYFSDRAGWIDVQDGLPRLGGKTGVELL